MKKNCNGCKALKHVNGSKTGMRECEFGHQTKCTKEINLIPLEYKPLQECPKPKNNSDYVNLLINNYTA